MKWHVLHYDPEPMIRAQYQFEQCRRAGCNRRRTLIRYWPAVAHGRPDWPQPAERAGQYVKSSGWRRPPDGAPAWPLPDPQIENEWVKFVAHSGRYPLADRASRRLRRDRRDR